MSEIGSPGRHSILSPHIMHDADLTVTYTPTSIDGLRMVQVDDEHIFTLLRCDFGLYPHSIHDFRNYMKSTRRHHANIESFQVLDSVIPFVHMYAAIVLCRHITHENLGISSRAVNVPYKRSKPIDLIIYTCYDPHTKTAGVSFVAQDGRTQTLLQRPMGFELVTGNGVQTCKVAQEESWMHRIIKIDGLLGWRVVIADRHELQPFTWPSNDDDVERAQFFKSHFGHGADGKNIVRTDSLCILQ